MYIIIGLYVDNLLIFSKHKTVISKLEWLLKQEYTIKNMRSAKYILEICIRQDQAQKYIILNQSGYIKKFLAEYRIDNANLILTLLNGKNTFMPTAIDKPRINQSKYQERIGKIIYAMIDTRADLAQAIGKLSQYTHNLAIQHQTELNHVLKYLSDTVDFATVEKHCKVGALRSPCRVWEHWETR